MPTPRSTAELETDVAVAERPMTRSETFSWKFRHTREYDRYVLCGNLVATLVLMGVCLMTTGSSETFGAPWFLAGFTVGYVATWPLQLRVGVVKAKGTGTLLQNVTFFFSMFVALFCAIAAAVSFS